MEFRINSHKANDYESDILVTIEQLCRNHSDITVDYQGKDGTVITASESAIRDIIAEVKDDREEYSHKMADTDSLSQVDDYEEKRKELKSVRNRLQNLVEDSSHQWREDE